MFERGTIIKKPNFVKISFSESFADECDESFRVQKVLRNTDLDGHRRRLQDRDLRHRLQHQLGQQDRLLPSGDER